MNLTFGKPEETRRRKTTGPYFGGRTSAFLEWQPVAFPIKRRILRLRSRNIQALHGYIGQRFLSETQTERYYGTDRTTKKDKT